MSKQYNHSNYVINKKKGLVITCWTEDTRYGFRHLAELHDSFYTLAKTKACYYNRTWESYTYESVINNLIGKSSIRNKTATKNRIRDIALGKVHNELKTISNIMSLGNLLTDNQKDANDWKTRMLKAGLDGRGLIMPEDWDELDETTKEARLNAVVKELS